MSFQASAWTRSVKTGSSARKAVLYAIAEDAAPHDEKFSGYHCCFPGQDRIGDGAEMTARSVRPHLTELEERGLIRRFPRFKSDGHRASDWYVLPIKSDGSIASPEEFAALQDPRSSRRKNRPPEDASGGRSGSETGSPPEAAEGHHRKPASGYPLEDPLDEEQDPLDTPPLRDDAIPGMEVEIAKPPAAPVAKRRAKGEVADEARIITEKCWEWAGKNHLHLTQDFVSVMGIVNTCLRNWVPRDRIASALASLTQAGQVVTSQSMARALRSQRTDGAAFRRPEDQTEFEQTIARARERDAAGGSSW